jgi:dsRNA-specific ribonuclease
MPEPPDRHDRHDWRDDLEPRLAADVARLDSALGVRLEHRELVDALIDPRGHLFQRLEYVGDSILDAVVLQALVTLQPWSEPSLAFLSNEQQALVSDHALGRVAARRGLPDVRTFPVSVHRLGDRVEACIAAVWADRGIDAADEVAERLVVGPGLQARRGRVRASGVPLGGGDERYEAAARFCGHDPVDPRWFGAAAGGGPVRRRLALVGDAVLEAAFSTAQFVDDPLATEALMSEERRVGTSNAVLARRAHELGLVDPHGDAPDRRSQADEAQALVGAATMDGGTRAGLDVAAAVLGRRFAPGPVDCPS